MPTRLKSSIDALVFLTCAAAFGLTLLAADKKVDLSPAGTWTWNFVNQNGDTIESVAKLKIEGDKLSGTVMRGANGMESPIENAKWSGEEISFETSRKRDGNTFISKYNGKFSGNSIKGKMELNFNGEPVNRDWEAVRGPRGISGNWKYTFTTSGGQIFEPKLKLKQQGDDVTGVLIFNENEAPISAGKVAGDDISFDVVRERDGQTFTSNYRAKLDGDTLKGQITSNFGGGKRVAEFEAKRGGK